MSSLLEEAIVDAKALKEAALKNAENVVLEKYSGEVKKALDTLLEQDELSETEGDKDDTLTEFTDEVPYAFQNEELDALEEDEIVEINFTELKKRLEEEDEVVEEDSLNDALEMADDMSGGEMAPELADSAAEDAAEMGADPVEPLQENDELEISEEMLEELVEKLTLDMGTSPAGFSSLGGAYNSVMQANNDAIAAAKEAHLEEEEEEEIEEDTAPDVVPIELYEAKVSELTESNKELRALVVEAKNQLTKLNLDNAKLVYQNKALNSASLNERQKSKVVESIRKADSVEEAKVIFETLQGAVGEVNASKPKSLSEAIKRPSTTMPRRRAERASRESVLKERFQRLAGISKTE